MKLRLIILSTMFAFLFFASATPEQEDVVIEEGKKESNEPKEEKQAKKTDENTPPSKEQVDAVTEIKEMMSSETVQQRELRKLRIYACTLMLSMNIKNNMPAIKELLEENKPRADHIYPRILATMQNKCVLKITTETASKVLNTKLYDLLLLVIERCHGKQTT